MAKQYKIKRYRQYGGGNSFRAKPHPFAVVLSILAIVILVFVGISIYEPIYNFITSDHSAGDISYIDDETAPDEAATEAPSEAERIPAAFSEFRAAYLPIATARNTRSTDEFLQSLEGSAVNSVMVDIKDASGYVLFRTTNAAATEWNVVAQDAIDLRELAETLSARGLALIVRMSAFRDPLSSSANREIAINYQDSDWLWLDAAAEAGGKSWLNPYSQGAWNYLTGLAVEAAEAGARMVVLDNVQFPGGSHTYASFGEAAASTTRGEILGQFVASVTESLEPYGVRASVMISAAAVAQDGDRQTLYGGNPLEIVGDSVVLGALPYQFGGDYESEALTIRQPYQDPGAATDAILSYISPLLANSTGETPAIIPLLQGGAEPEITAVPFSNMQVRAQIDAVEAHGLSEYILYTTHGDYALQ